MSSAVAKKSRGTRVTTLQDAVLQYVRGRPGQTTSQIARALRLHITDARRILKALQTKKLIGQQTSLAFGEYDSRWHPEEKPDA